VQRLKHPWQLKIELVSCIIELPVHHHSSHKHHRRRFEVWQGLEARGFNSVHQEVGFSTSLILEFIMLVV
jgi:hypothetical protein